MQILKNIKIVLTLLVVVMATINIQAQKPLEGIRICLDAGHGGHDGDDRPTELNIGKTYYESDANWEAIGYLDSLLTGLGAITKNTKITNDPDSPFRQPSLSDRVAVANNFGADFFHSFHTNGSSNQSVNTTIVIYAGPKNGEPDVPEAFEMAEIQSPQLFKYMRTTAERSWADIPLTGFTNGLGVLNNLQMPGVLSECSFHSNREEGRRLMNSGYRKAAAWALVKSFLEFYEQPELTFGELGGIIKDGSGNPINGTVVTMFPATDSAKIYLGDHFRNGFYFFDRLDPGDYEIKIDATGFEPDTITVTVEAGQYTETDVTLDAIADGVAAETPTIKFVGNPATGTGVTVSWEAPAEKPLGYRLYYALDNTLATWVLAADERIIHGDSTSFTLDSRWSFQVVPDDPIFHFRLSAVSTTEVEGESGDVYSRSSDADSDKVLIVDGFDRTDGGYSDVTHSFATDYFVGINSTKYTNVSTTSNESVLSGDVQLSDYELVTWFLGDESSVGETFSDAEQELLKTYLESGGKLIVSGTEIGSDLDNAGSASDKSFANDYLKIAYAGDGVAENSPATGVTGTLFDGITAGFGSAYPVTSADNITAHGGSETIFEYAVAGNFGGVAYKGTFGSGSTEGGVISLTFPMETGFISNVKLIMEASMDYLEVGRLFPDPPGRPTLHAVWATSEGLRASWAANTENNLIGYRIYYATDDELTDWLLVADEEKMDETSTSILVPFDEFADQPNGIAPQHYKLTAVSEGGYESVESDIYSSQYVESAPTALILDGFDRNGSYILETHSFSTNYFKALVAKDTFTIHTAANETLTDASVLLTDYDMVIWIAGDETTATESFSTPEQALVSTYLENGGRFFVSGSEIGWDLFDQGNTTDKSFYNNYLKAVYKTDGGSTSSPATGIAGTAFEGVEIEFGIVYFEDYADEIDIFEGSERLLEYSNASFGGVGYRGLFGESTTPGVGIYFSFPLETALQDDMNEGIGAVVDYLALFENTQPGAENDLIDGNDSGATILDVLANDWDLEANIDPATLTIVNQPAKGSATVQDGKIEYTPGGEVFLSDTLTYQVADVDGEVSNISEVVIVINYVPITSDDVFTVIEGMENTIDVLGNDIDGDDDINVSSLQVIDQPTNGSITVDNGVIKYTSTENNATDDSFTYQVADEKGFESNVSSVSISIQRFPVATNDEIVAVKGESIDVDVLANDSDANNDLDATSLQIVDPPGDGVAKVVDGIIEFIMEANVESDHFTYQVTDVSGLASNIATVNISVEGVLSVIESNTLLAVFPNPVDDILNLEFKDQLGSQVRKVIIFDESGKKMSTTKRKADQNDSIQLGVSSLRSGIYFVHAFTKEKELIVRVIKQ